MVTLTRLDLRRPCRSSFCSPRRDVSSCFTRPTASCLARYACSPPVSRFVCAGSTFIFFVLRCARPVSLFSSPGSVFQPPVPVFVLWPLRGRCAPSFCPRRVMFPRAPPCVRRFFRLSLSSPSVSLAEDHPVPGSSSVLAVRRSTFLVRERDPPPPLAGRTQRRRPFSATDLVVFPRGLRFSMSSSFFAWSTCNEDEQSHDKHRCTAGTPRSAKTRPRTHTTGVKRAGAQRRPRLQRPLTLYACATRPPPAAGQKTTTI